MLKSWVSCLVGMVDFGDKLMGRPGSNRISCEMEEGTKENDGCYWLFQG